MSYYKKGDRVKTNPMMSVGRLSSNFRGIIKDTYGDNILLVDIIQGTYKETNGKTFGVGYGVYVSDTLVIKESILHQFKMKFNIWF